MSFLTSLSLPSHVRSVILTVINGFSYKIDEYTVDKRPTLFLVIFKIPKTETITFSLMNEIRQKRVRMCIQWEKDHLSLIIKIPSEAATKKRKYRRPELSGAPVEVQSTHKRQKQSDEDSGD